MEMPDLVDVMTTPTCCISIRIRLKRSGFEALYRANSCRRHLKNHPIAITLITASISTSHLRFPAALPRCAATTLRCRAMPPPRCDVIPDSVVFLGRVEPSRRFNSTELNLLEVPEDSTQPS